MIKNDVKKFGLLIKVRGHVNSWVRMTHEIHEHQSPTNNNDSTVNRIKKNILSGQVNTVSNNYNNFRSVFL